MSDSRNALYDEMLAVINRHIKEARLQPQHAAHVLVLMAGECLSHLAWMPPHVDAASDCVEEAERHLAYGLPELVSDENPTERT